MNTMDTPAFRSSMGGFNKKDVNDYIARLNREFCELTAAKDEEIKNLKKSLADAKNAFDSAAETSTEAAAAELERANSLIGAQTEQLEAQSEKIAALEKELAEANQRLSLSSSKVAQYDSATSRMGEIFLEASNDAERIRAQAKVSADELIERTEADCKERLIKVEAYLTEISRTRSNEIAKLLVEVQADISNIMENFESKTKQLVSVSVPSYKSTAETAEAEE